MGAGALLVKSACPRDCAPAFAHGVPCTHAQPGLYIRCCLQACNPKPRPLDGSHGRTTLVLLVFCDHQGVPLHLPSVLLLLLIPGTHCNYKSLVKTVSMKQRDSWPIEFPTPFFQKKETVPASLNIHGSIHNPSLRASSKAQLSWDAGYG